MGEVAKRLLATVVFVVSFYVLGLVPLPTMARDFLAFGSDDNRLHVTALGIQPWILGFMYLELLSFVFRRTRQLRRGGTTGRRRLNKLAFGAGIVLAIIQAAGIAIALNRQGLLVPNSLFGVMLTGIILVAGSVMVLLLAAAVSRWGIGNGFCLFLILPVADAIFRYYRSEVWTGRLTVNGVEPLLVFAAVGLLIKMFVHGPVGVLTDKEKDKVSATFSTFPQGLAPVYWTYGVFGAVSALQLPVPRTPILELCTAVLIVVFSLCTFHLFSSRKRLETNLPVGALPPEDDLNPVRWLVPATALLVVFGTVLSNRGFLGFRLQQIPSIYVLGLLVAYVVDLVVEIRFRMRYEGQVARLIEMDNVHGASYLLGILKKHGIDSVARAFHYRSLFFFLEPIVKMELLVPAVKMTQAQEITRAEKVEVV